MNITGKITLFPKEVGEKKTIIFETSICRKDDDGNYVDNHTIRVQFAKNILPDEKKTSFKTTKAYIVDIEGFLTTRGYDDKNGKHRTEPLIYVTKAKVTDSKNVVRKAKEESNLIVDGEELPF